MDTTIINKTIGYVLLLIGLMLIIIPLFQAYNIYFNKATIPEIFKSQKTQINQNVSNTDFQKQIENAFTKALPIDLIIKSINLTSWLIIMLVFMLGGKQISLIGIRLIKE